ncbi:MAG: translation elongation factor Ts [Deltaproteobacteria bacterium]|nr:MAG: translation elongation factor Ts [Deltaproteobacteria bacterium]
MAEVTAQMVKELRDKSGAGIMDCKQALKDCDCDIEKAMDFLRKKGLATAKKRAGKDVSEGRIESYIHMGGKIGVLVEVNCETDFVAKNNDFVDFCKNIAMHIAASSPEAIVPEDLSKEVCDRERKFYEEQVREMGKPDNIIDKIVDGKMEKFYKEACLLTQPYVKDPKLSIQDVINELVAKIGENVVIKRFSRFQIGG